MSPAARGPAIYRNAQQDPVPHEVLARYQLPDMVLTEHRFTVPLDHRDPGGETLQIFAREVAAALPDTRHGAGHRDDYDAGPVPRQDSLQPQHPDQRQQPAQADRARSGELPWLVFFQGGPGHRANRPTSLTGWLKEAARSFRILLLDQRGTGLSAPINRQTLPLRGDTVAQADYLIHFRADSIVADAEAIRHAFGVGRWSVLGQSFGGFCVLSYLSFAPEGLREAMLTGGLGPVAGRPDAVYRATYARVAARNTEYFERYPEDRSILEHIAAHLRRTTELMPTGEPLTVRRLQMLGHYLGGNARIDELHYLLQDAFAPTANGQRLSDSFLAQTGSLVSYAGNPLYALLHESIYCQDEASNWSADRVLAERPEFAEAAEPLLLTGEMIFPWYFQEDPALVPLAEAAELTAARSDWGPLYDTEQLGRNEIPVAAAVYRDDIFVDRDLSMATAAAVTGLQVWETSDYHHDGLRQDGEMIFALLLRMCRTAPSPGIG